MFSTDANKEGIETCVSIQQLPRLGIISPYISINYTSFIIRNTASPICIPYLLLLPEHFVLQFIGQAFVRRPRTGVMVYVPLSTTTDMIVLVFRTCFVHCSLWDYIGVMCASQLGGFDFWGINVASTTALCIPVSSRSQNESRAVKEPSRAVLDIRLLNMLHHLDLQLALHGQFHRRHSCMKRVSQDTDTSAK